MAKRKRKMTLFDVINAGQPIGIQVRQRIPTYQPTPELPVKKKLAKLFGRHKAEGGRDPNAPLSAAEELELLRRELGAKPADHVVERAPEPASESEYDPTARWAERETTSHRERETAEVSRESIPETPRVPRKPIRIVLAETWEKLSPTVETGRAKCVAWSRSAWSQSRTLVDSLRNVNQRHAATAATALAAIVVLGGSFYIGKVLLQRPAADALVDADGINTQPRPEVMDVDPNSNQAVANVSRSVPSVALERGAPQQPQTQATSTVFGGRNLDQNYVIAQSYYTQAEADAAVDVLAKYNIRAGVEKNLPGWSSGGRDFFSVVSYDGFSKLRDNAAYQSFLQTLTMISDRETGSMLPKRLDPRPYRYRAE